MSSIERLLPEENRMMEFLALAFPERKITTKLKITQPVVSQQFKRIREKSKLEHKNDLIFWELLL